MLFRSWPLIRPNPIQVVDPKDLNKSDKGGKVPEANDTGASNLGRQIPRVRLVTQQDSVNPEKANPPVVVVTGDGQWTLASDDPEALAAMERLLATLLNPTMEPFATAGNYSVYILRHADSKQMRELFRELFRSGDRESGGSAASLFQRVKIVSDPRTNALVIGGNRADRKIIEELLGVFDSKDLIDRLQQITPILIQIGRAHV